MRKLVGASALAAVFTIAAFGPAASQGPMDWPCARMCAEEKPHDHAALWRKYGKKWRSDAKRPNVTMSLPCCKAPPVFTESPR